MSTKKLLTIAGVTLTALVLAGAGCASSTNTSNTNTANSNANSNKNTVTVDNTNKANTNKKATTPTISIVAPEAGDTVEDPFDMEVEVKGFTLSDAVEGANVEGEGHIHLWVDGEYYTPSTAAEFEVKDVEAGEHELMVSLQNNDHTDLATPVKSKAVTVTVE